MMTSALALDLDLSLPGTSSHGRSPDSSNSSGWSASPSEAEAEDEGGYRIDAGDLLSVIVYGEDDLTLKEVKVPPLGRISFPLLGQVQVQGLSAKQLERDITRRLADGYLKKPLVSVSIDRYRLYYIKGEIKKPGGYSYMEGLTVQKAVAIAGGYTPRASESKISVVRESAPETTQTQISPSTAIYPGDVVTVGESFF